tara:strand:- start:61 stop:426 length:366 start_codon:yes stop_codon:yes gene_type:complete
MTQYSKDHPYHKEANQFINALKKKKKLAIERVKILKPIYEKFNVTSDWDIPSEFWQSLEWKTSPIKRELDENSRKHLNIIRRTAKLKYSYWAVEPNGERWGEIYPEQWKRKQEMKAKRGSK